MDKVMKRARIVIVLVLVLTLGLGFFLGEYLIKLGALFLQRIFDALYVACRGIIRFKQAVNVKSVARLCRHSAGGGVRLLQISAGLKLCHLVYDGSRGAGESTAFTKVFASDGLAVVDISLNNSAQYQALSVSKTVCVRFHRFLLVLLFKFLALLHTKC